MNPLTDDPSNLLPEGLDAEMLQDLERQSLDQIRKLRKHQRFEIRVPVVLRPGNSSAGDQEVTGTSIDFSSGGCAVQFATPVGVGDVFRLTVTDDRLDVPMVFARCMRCRLVREDVFEVGFSFFTPISLDHTGEEGSEALLD